MKIQRVFRFVALILIGGLLCTSCKSYAAPEIQPPTLDTTEESRRQKGVCGLDADGRGAVGWFQQIPTEEAPTSGKKLYSSEDIPYVIIDGIPPLDPKYGTPRHSDCYGIELKPGWVWIHRGVAPRGKAGGTW